MYQFVKFNSIINNDIQCAINNEIFTKYENFSEYLL